MKSKLILFICIVIFLSLFMSIPVLLAQNPVLDEDLSIIGNQANVGEGILDAFASQNFISNEIGSMAEAVTITEYSLPISPTNLHINHVDEIWFSSFEDNAIGKLDINAGQVTVYSRTNDDGGVWAIQQDSTGNIWYATQNAQPNDIVGRYEPAVNRFVEWPISAERYQGHYGLTLDSNTGNVWVATRDQSSIVAGIYCLSPSDNQVIAWSTWPYVEVYDIDIDPNGQIWLTVQMQSLTPGKQGLIRLNPITNEMTVWEMPIPGSQPFRLDTATGEIWLTELAPVANSIAQLQQATNTLFEFRVPISNSFPAGLIKDDHRIWFTTYNTNAIGELDLMTASPTTTTILSPITLAATRTTTTILPNSYEAITSTEASIVTVTSITPTVSGAFTFNPLPIIDSKPFGITLEDSQTQVWFAEISGRIGTMKIEVYTNIYIPLIIKE